MKVTITPGKIRGTVNAPASKSDMQRACAAALLAGGRTVLHNPGFSDDDLAALETIQLLGARVTANYTCQPNQEDSMAGNSKEIIIESDGLNTVASTINCGESGLGIRMFTPIASLADQQLTLTGTGSLLNRPMNFFDQILPQLGVSFESSNGNLPLKVKGPLQPRDIEIDGSLSSQFLTGLMM
ncbi:MAG TPA: 3-phosphoshikimate 1-carboxyvinyltransferase, partial [Parasegetibacter sp.]